MSYAEMMADPLSHLDLEHYSSDLPPVSEIDRVLRVEYLTYIKYKNGDIHPLMGDPFIHKWIVTDKLRPEELHERGLAK